MHPNATVPGREPKVFAEELLCHWAPHFCALDICNMSRIDEIDPVRLVQLRTDEKIQVLDHVVLTNERRA